MKSEILSWHLDVSNCLPNGWDFTKVLPIQFYVNVFEK